MAKEKVQCKFIRANGMRCKQPVYDGTEYCWYHKDGEINPEVLEKMSYPFNSQYGTSNGRYKHGLYSNTLKMKCNSRCYMYEECEVRTDTEEGVDLFGGICFYEVDSDAYADKLLQMEGLKSFLVSHLLKLNSRINRGLRYENNTGGFLSEPEISSMQRNVSALGFNLLQIYDKEEMHELRDQLKEIKELYEKNLKRVG